MNVVQEDADPGLFGPESVTWRIHGDPSAALGGLRALMLQALHPLAMAGVAQHSSFRQDPWGRLARTGEYLATVTYGTTSQARRAGRIVRQVHARLAGVEPESGVAYRVGDPSLLLWVHCAEVDSFLTAYRRCGGIVTRADADRYLAEQVRAAALVGIDPASVPDCEQALTAYFRDIRPQLRATAAAHETLRYGFNPPLPLVARPAWATVATVAFGLLPRWARRLYGWRGALTAHPGSDLAASVAARSLTTALRLLPASIVESPARRAAYARLGQPAPDYDAKPHPPGSVSASAGTAG